MISIPTNLSCPFIIAGVDFKVKFINVHNKRVKLFIWDTAGTYVKMSNSRVYHTVDHVPASCTRAGTFPNTHKFLLQRSSRDYISIVRHES